MAGEEEISYNRLIQLYQQEKKGGSPVPLQADFHDRVREYLERLRASYDQERSRDPSSMKSLQLADQLQKARALQVDVINLRLRKFLLLAHQSLTGAGIDTKSFTPEEKALFEKVVADICSGRNRILEGGEPAAEDGERSGQAPAAPVKCAQPRGAPDDRREAARTEPPKAMERQAPAPSAVTVDSNELVVLRILEDVPDFAIGEGGSTSLRKKDVVALPGSMARVLVQHKKARPVV